MTHPDPDPAPASPAGGTEAMIPEPEDEELYQLALKAHARVQDLLAELARVRRHRDQLVKAGDELVNHCFVACDECYCDSSTGLVLCKACRLMRERWNAAKADPAAAAEGAST